MAENAMSSLMSNLAKPLDVANIQAGTEGGIKVGVELAQRKAQLEQMQQEMTFKRQALEQQKDEHMTTLFDSLFKETDPVVRKMKFLQIKRTGQNVGRPVPDEVGELWLKSDESRESAMRALDSGINLDDPIASAKFKRDFMGSMSGGFESMSKFIKDSTEHQAKLNEAEAISKRQLTNLAEKSRLEEVAKLLNSSSVPRSVKDVLGRGVSDPNYSYAYGVARELADQQNGEEFKNKQEKIKAETDAAKGGLEVKKEQLEINKTDQKRKEKDTGSLVDHRKAMEQLTAQRISSIEAMAGRRLEVSEKRQIQGAIAPIEKTIGFTKERINQADLGLDRLKPGMKWIDMSDVAADYNWLVTGKANAAFAGEDRRTFTDFKAIFDKFEGKVAGQEKGGPTDAEINLFRDRFQGMKDVLSKYHDDRLKKMVQGRVTGGLLKPEFAKSFFDTNKAGENSVFDLNLGKPPLPAGQSPEPRQGAGIPGGQPAAQVDIDAETKKATAAIQQIRAGTLKGTTEDAVRALYKKKTKQDLKF